MTMQQYDNATIQQYNNTVRCLTGKYRKMEPDCQEGARAQLERVKKFCKERKRLYEKQNDLEWKKQKDEKSSEQ